MRVDASNGEVNENASAPVQEQEGHVQRVRFKNWTKDEQVKAFFSWLPSELHHIPKVDWTTLPYGVMLYLTHTASKSPDVIPIALFAATARGAMSDHVLLKNLSHLNMFFRTIRGVCQIEHLSDLKREHIWHDFIEKTKMTSGRLGSLKAYASFSESHYPRYLRRLEEHEQLHMQHYALPVMPPGFVPRYGGLSSITKAGQSNSKEKSDILVHLYSVLRQIVRFRKQLAERMLIAIRETCHRVDAGEAVLPVHFQHTDIIPEVNKNARTVSEVEIQGREVTMHFVLWDKPTWAIHHKDRYSVATMKRVRRRSEAYSQKLNCYFVQFDGPTTDLLWFGELIEQDILHSFHSGIKDDEDATYHQRWMFARQLGFTSGCTCTRPNVLDSGDKWFSSNAQVGEMIFEPEALYRGILFGATLATLALSNGSRVSELLQYSFNKERRITQRETVTVLGNDGQPVLGPDNKVLTKEFKIHLQYLLPKGAKAEEERQLFPLGNEATVLLGQVKHLLEEVHGEIPIVHPSRSSAKYEHLKPEQYFFQWEASPDGKIGIIAVQDVETLLRFIFHGLELATAAGKPILVTAHLLRHVMSTDARQYRNVPPEAIAHFFLHHRLQISPRQSSSPSVVSNYYWQMTKAQQLTHLREYLDELDELDHAILAMAPSPRDLEQANEDLQNVYDVWQTLHPTAFGNCGCPGLCPRGYNRSLCIGCPFLITDPSRRGAAQAWRTSYARQAEELQIQGNLTDARQMRILVQQLDDHIATMRLQLQAEADGRYIPLYKVLAQTREKVEDGDAEEI